MFEKAREKYKNTEYKMLIAKIADKYNYCISKNKIVYTDFLNVTEKAIVEKVLKEEKILNSKFFGGNIESDRNILIFYPEKINEKMLEKNYDNILKVIKIFLPSEIKYEHKNYLSGIMKLGIKREKIGDIIVTDYGADIVVLKEVCDILLNGLKDLTRFRKAIIEEHSIFDITKTKNEFQDISIIVSSLRLDSFVSEIARSSRSKAIELINEGRVFLNHINEFKIDKKINVSDIITIRGKGKFIFESIQKNTKSGRLLVNLKKYK